MKLLEGKKIKKVILKDLKKKISREKVKPGLAVILIGENKASEVYVSLKQKAAGEVDMDFWVLKFSARDSEKDILQSVRDLNKDESISGVIVQLPLPNNFNTQKIVNAVDFRKDVDGFHPKSVKLFQDDKNDFWPVFPQAVLRILESSKEKLAGKEAVVVANSDLFGKIMVAALEKKKIKAQYALSSKLKVQSLKLKEADIVITAVGKPGTIKGAMIKKGAIVIDGGIAKKKGKVLGDVDFESVKKMAGFISPVPGGVGPVTIACLLNNVYEAFKKQQKGI